MIDLRQVQAFVAVVEQRSFTQAAERLHIGQSGLSSQVKKLERRLGYDLFDRSGRDVRPTDEGRKLYRAAQELLASAEHFDRSAGTSSTAPVLRLGIAENGVNALAVDLLSRLRLAFDDTDLELERLSLLEQHEHIGIKRDGVIARPPFASPLSPDVDELLLALDPLVLAVHETHALSVLRSVTTDQVAELDHLALTWVPEAWRAAFPVLHSGVDHEDRNVGSFRDAMASVSINRSSCVMPASFAATYNLADVMTVPIEGIDAMRVVLLTADQNPLSLAGRLTRALADLQLQTLPLIPNVA